jgi:CRP/FNR family transcriptional regulator, cyclic AMP receptor protein
VRKDGGGGGHGLLRRGDPAARGPEARVELSAADLASRVGVKREQVDEVLMKLLKAKIVTVHPDAMVIPDVAKLRQFLEFLEMKAQFGDVG